MSGKEILVVDDDRSMVATLCDILSLHGWSPLPAYDGEAAVQLAADHNVAVVLMDVRMPGRDGVSALEAIRARRPQTRVILMTAYAAQELLVRGAAGAVEILQKPVDLSRLVALVEEARLQAGTVLVVDDDPAFVHSLCDLLETRGRRTIAAGSLDAAVVALQRAAPGIVLLDLQLSDRAPLDALTTIRRTGPAVLLILYSGHPELLTEVLEQVGPSLVAGVLAKPFDIERLLSALDAAT